MDTIKLINQHGSFLNPIIIDGSGGDINGDGIKIPIFLDNCSYIKIYNINAHSSSAEVVRIKDSHHIILQEICAWDAHLLDNRMVYGLHGSHHCQVIDCAGWGSGRKIFDASQEGNDIEWIRCFGRWDKSNCGGPKIVFALAYNNFRQFFKDCIGYINIIPKEFVGIFAADRIDNGQSADTIVDGCCAISGNVCFGFHPTIVSGISFFNCLDYTAVQKFRKNIEQIERIRTIWKKSPILNRIYQFSGTDVMKILK